MADPRRCRDCGGELKQSPAGPICPRCAMTLALGESDAEILPEGDRIGPYLLVRKLGGGGMGEVWLAEQQTPVQREVALKIVRADLLSDDSIARFQAERQAIALMEHPSVAKIFDAGTAPDGRPYFAMEYVDGVPITEYADRNGLSTAARVELFIAVCEGVQHAHQKAVIHRDLKPGNILISEHSGHAVPKIIDFGIAKAIDRRLVERTLATEYGVLIGTPEYMSPEQAAVDGGQHVDTRSDVYSLGVLLYELLVGALPLDVRRLREAGYDALLREVREVEPPRPSERLSALENVAEAAGSRSTDPGSLARQLRGELDWISMKALDKQPDRRYDSPAGLARDLHRYLEGEPVAAGPPSLTYRVSRFVRRHRWAVAAATAVAVALLLGAAGASWGLVRARAAESAARRDAEVSSRVSQFMVDLFEISDPSEARGNTITAREMLDRGVEQIESGLAGEPQTQARLMATMGEVHLYLGLYERADELLTSALDVQRKHLGATHRETLATREQFGRLRTKQGQSDEAIQTHREVLALRVERLGARHPDTLRTRARLGSALFDAAQHEEAERELRETAELQREVIGPKSTQYLETIHALAMPLGSLERHDEAEPLIREALAGWLELHGEDSPETLNAMSDLAIVLRRKGEVEEALELALRVLDASRRVEGEDHPNTLLTQFNCGAWLKEDGRIAEADEMLSDVLQRQRRALGDTHKDTLLTMTTLGNVASDLDRFDRAEALLREASEGYVATLGDHPYAFIALANLGTFYAENERFAEAIEMTERAVAGLEATLGAGHRVSMNCRGNLAEHWRKHGRADLAIPMLEQTLEQARTSLQQGDEVVGLTLAKLGSSLIDLGREEEARATLTEAIELLSGRVGPDNRILRLAREQLEEL